MSDQKQPWFIGLDKRTKLVFKYSREYESYLIFRKLSNDEGEYVGYISPKDGVFDSDNMSKFTAKDLRIIADWIDEIMNQPNTNTNPITPIDSVGNNQEIESIVQETVLKLFENPSPEFKQAIEEKIAASVGNS